MVEIRIGRLTPTAPINPNIHHAPPRSGRRAIRLKTSVNAPPARTRTRGLARSDMWQRAQNTQDHAKRRRIDQKDEARPQRTDQDPRQGQHRHGPLG